MGILVGDVVSKASRFMPVALAAVLACAQPGYPQAAKPRVLVFFGCGGFVHASIPYINTIWLKLAAEEGIDIDTSSVTQVFTRVNLDRYAAVLWNNATHPGTIMDSSQRSAWLAYARKGGYVGMHAAGDVSDTWPDYVAYMGATNSQHSSTLTASLDVEPGQDAATHPILVHAGWPAHLQLTDEWYSWRINPRLNPGIHILYSLDEKTFTPGAFMGTDHPIMWYRTYPEGGRMVYVGIGHNIDQLTPTPDKGYALLEKLMRACLLWAVHRLPESGNALVAPPARNRSPLPLLSLGLDGRMLYSPVNADLSGRRWAR